MKTDEIARVMNAFNRSKKPWAMTGELAARMHSYHTGMRYPKPKEFEFIVKNNNLRNFSTVLEGMKYTSLPSRRFWSFVKPGELPIVLRWSTNNPRSVTYEKYPVQSLEDMIHSYPNLKKVLKTRKNIERSVFEKLNTSLN